MSIQEKFIGLGALTIIVGSFMPWYSVTLSFDQGETISNAFSQDLGVIGFVIMLMTILSLLYLVAEQLHIRLPQFGYKKSQILFFLMGQSFFLILLTLAIYTKRAMDFTTAGLRFGIYISLIGGFLAAFAAFAKVQKVKEKQAKNFMHQEENIQKEEENEHQPMYFGEDKNGPIISPAFQASAPTQEKPEKSPESPPFNSSEKKGRAIHPDQANFFAKEAGIK